MNGKLSKLKLTNLNYSDFSLERLKRIYDKAGLKALV